MFDVEIFGSQYASHGRKETGTVEGSNVEPVCAVDGGELGYDGAGAPEFTQELGVPGDQLTIDSKDIGAWRLLDPVKDLRVVTGLPRRLRPAAANEVPRLQAGEVRTGQRFLNDVV